MTTASTYFTVEQGIWSERDKNYGWRHWDNFAESKAAKKCARDLVKHPDPRAAKIAARVLRVAIVAQYMPEDHPFSGG